MNVVVAIFLNSLLIVFGVTLLEGIHADSYYAAIAVMLTMGCANGLMKSALQEFKPNVSIVQWLLILLLLNGGLLIGLEILIPTFQVEGVFWLLSFTVLLGLFNLLISEFEVLQLQEGKS